MDLVFIAILIAMTVLITKVVQGRAETAVRQKLLSDRLDPVEVKAVWWKGTKYTTYVKFTARTRDGRTVTGHAMRGTDLQVFYDSDFDRLAHLRERLSGGPSGAGAQVVLDDENVDLETRIRFETNQRLEKLQGDREAFLANDANSDGVVDANEWDSVRARVDAEVRAELTGTPEPAADVESGESLETDRAPEPQPDEPQPDGHW